MSMFVRSIPGQSLTSEPKAMPYERPPEVVDPEQALQIHLAGLTNPERMEAIFTLLENDIDLVTVVEGITRNAVANGIHSVDVSLIVAPVIHEFIKTTADAVGVSYDEGFNDEAEDSMSFMRQEAMATKMIEDMGFKPEQVAEQIKETPQEEVVQEEAPRGLMARM